MVRCCETESKATLVTSFTSDAIIKSAEEDRRLRSRRTAFNASQPSQRRSGRPQSVLKWQCGGGCGNALRERRHQSVIDRVTFRCCRVSVQWKGGFGRLHSSERAAPNAGTIFVLKRSLQAAVDRSYCHAGDSCCQVISDDADWSEKAVIRSSVSVHSLLTCHLGRQCWRTCGCGSWRDARKWRHPVGPTIVAGRELMLQIGRLCVLVSPARREAEP